MRDLRLEFAGYWSGLAGGFRGRGFGFGRWTLGNGDEEMNFKF